MNCLDYKHTESAEEVWLRTGPVWKVWEISLQGNGEGREEIEDYTIQEIPIHHCFPIPNYLLQSIIY